METKIKEYAEEMPVKVIRLSPEYGEKFKSVINAETYKAYNEKRYVIEAQNEAGCNCTLTDLKDVLMHVKTNMPELWDSI